MEIKLFSKWRPSTILNLRKLPFWSRDRYLHVILHIHSEIRINRSIQCQDIAKKRFSIWRPSAILNLQNLDFFVKCTSWELKSTSDYQIWSKSDNSRPRYGDKAIFKMAAFRHLEFAKKLQFWSRVLYWHVILYFLSKFRVNRSIWRRDIVKKRFSIWRPSAILNLQNFDFFLLNVHHGNWNVHLPTKFDQNRIILGWDMEIKLFSKWRPSAILNLRKLPFWSRDLYRHVILHLCSKLCAYRPIWRRDIAKKRFSIWRPSAILYLLWRHHIVSENCILRSQVCVKFSWRSVL